MRAYRSTSRDRRKLVADLQGIALIIGSLIAGAVWLYFVTEPALRMGGR